MPQTLLKDISDSMPDVGSTGQKILFRGPNNEVQIASAANINTLVTLPRDQNAFLFRLSSDDSSVADIVLGMQEDDAKAGLWVLGHKQPPRQIFHGWINWYARGPQNQICFIQGKADMKGVLWKADWSGHGLTRVPVSIPLPFDYWFPFPVALRMQEQKGSAVAKSLVPIAIGHALAIGSVVMVAAFLGKALPLLTIRYSSPRTRFSRIQRECVRCVCRVDSFTTWLQIAWFEFTVELIKSFEAAHKGGKMWRTQLHIFVQVL